MLDGPIRLSLLIGPAVPAPVSQAVIESLQSIEVQNRNNGPSGFQLTFDFNNSPELNQLLLQVGAAGPFVRCVIAVVLKGTPHVIADGVITQQQVVPDPASGQSTLTLTGEDLSAVMNQVDATGIPYPAMPPMARVALILSKYAVFGVLPVVLPSVLIDVPIPTDRIPSHRGTDLAYINMLARDVGYVFYVEPGPAVGTSVAYWGPEIKVGPIQPALTVNMGGASNVEAISFRFDAQKRTLPLVMMQNEESRVTLTIPIPDITPLNPPLGLLAPPPTKVKQLRQLPGANPIKAAMQGLAMASKASDVITADGSLDVLRYGQVLKPHRLVGVRGVGEAFDGPYFVQSIRHSIKRGEYKQNFTLTRNAMISPVGNLPV